MTIGLSVLIRLLFFGIAQCILIIACYQYWSKRKTLDGQFLLIGSLIVAISVLIESSSFYFFTSEEIFESPTFDLITSIANIFIFLGSLSFAIGFYILIQKHLKKLREEDSDEVDRIGKK
jgi:hypothetical protein